MNLLFIFIAILAVYAFVFLQLDKAAGSTSNLCTTIRSYVNTYGIEAVRQAAKERGYSDKLIKSLERRCLK